ncbi:MAG: M16 family metallopeptidase [Bacteroidota bacterium]
MRKLSLVVALISLAVGRLWAADLPILDPARVTEKALPNGLKVIVKEDRQWPVVAIGVYIRAGSLYEGDKEHGAAHLVEHMLFEATDEGNQKLAPCIEALGGRIAATTLRDFVHVDVVISSRYLEQVLPLLTKAVFEASFSVEQMKREQAVVKREIADRRERADLYMDEMIWRLAHKTHPYGRPIGGASVDVTSLPYDAVKAFHKRFYVPNNASFVVVGDVEPAWLEGRLKELTSGYPAADTGWTAPAPEPPPTEPRIKTENLPREVSLMSFAWQAPSVADKTDVCAMDLIYTILGQGRLGRLNARLVNDQKVLLAAEAEFLTQKYPGLLLITAVVSPAREAEAQAAVVKEVAQLAEQPVSAEELARAKRLLYTEYAFSNESYDDQVGSMGFYASIDSYRFALDYISTVMAVTPEQLQQTAAKYLKANAFSLAVLHGQRNGRPDESAELNQKAAVRS